MQDCEVNDLPTPAKICIIDDDESVREAIEQLVQSLGYDTETFGSAEDYLSCGHIADTACLISDVHMPGMTGFDMHNGLVTTGYNIPIIFMSADPGEALRALAVETGVIGFLNKPVNADQLIDYLNRALGPPS